MNAHDPSPQEEELEALRSIYGTDWEDLPPQKTAWNIKGEEGWWTVVLRGADERVSVKLKGRFTKLYPSAAPILSIEEPKGLTPNHVHTLNKLINDKAKSFSSRRDPAPYIFDINDCVIDWISNNHVALPKLGEQGPTLMEEMAQREEAQRAAEVKQSQAQKEQARAREEEQNRLLNERIQLDTSRKAQKASQAIQDEAERKRQEALSSLQDGELETRELMLDTPISVDGYDGAWRSWVLFEGKKEPLWTSYTAEADGGDVEYVKASLPTICVKVVDFSAPFYSTPQGRKRVDAVAVEVARLREVNCENIVRIYGVKRDKSPKGWERLIVLTEKVEGGKVKSWLPREGFGEELAREYITQLLSGLAGIHRIGAQQKQIDPTTVFLSPGTSGDLLAKLSGTGYARRISDLNRSNQFLRSHEDTIPDSWLSPDEIDSPYTYTSKRDVWHIGVLLVQLLFGAQSLWRYPNLNILLQHIPGVSDSMADLLNGLLHPNSKKRFTAEEALSKARIIDEVTRRDNRNSTGPIAIAGQNAALPSPQAPFGTSPNQLTYFPSNPLRSLRQSRYREDFEEVEFLGKGGFGEVVKARNRLDGRAYAIKKVKLRPEDNTAKVYREVNNLSRVSHQYIVRYHACWIEDISHQAPMTEESSDTPTPTASVSEEASDPFAINFDDISRRDQSRSASFPRIRFAHADDSEDEDSDSDSDDSSTESDSSDETAADPSDLRERGRSQGARPGAVPMQAPAGRGGHIGPSGSATGTTTDDESVRSILYIQMEFVEKQTLREAISAGLDDEEVWRLLGQILQALAHMSSLGIVHRDLKPSNILLDASGNVKIADFGLSTTELTGVEVAAAPEGDTDFSDRTSGIGTSLYIAPEVAISRSYNEKADMYSLGVIFFEMCFAFKTNMERVYILNALRQPSITFPPAWPKDVKVEQREIVEWLLRHDPATRPSAQQLLASPLLPAREKQKEFYDGAIAELTNPRSDHYPSLLEALFDTQAHFHGSFENRTDDFTYDNEHSHDDQLQIWLTVVLQRLVDLLQRHGAVETYIPLFIPETLLLQAFPDLSPVRLLDQNGKIVQLPSSDLLSMARSATRREIERIKRYHVGHRYSDHAAGGQPNSVGEMSFDIISPLRSFVAEAELLDVVDKVISEFRGVKESAMAEYEFHISHESVLAAILNAVPEKARSAVLKALKGISSNSTSATKVLFSGIAGLPKHTQDDLEQCCVVDDFMIVRRKLENLFPGLKRRMSSGLDALGTIIGLARACGVTRRILFRPTLSRNAEFFRGGFMFECVRRGKQRELIAFGGRYDSLLEHFKAPSQVSRRKVYGVGMSINVEQLARMVRKHESGVSKRLMDLERIEERSFGYWSPARCDVYVASVSQVDLSTRLSIVSELWRAGIKADLQYDDERTIEMLELECIEQNTLFIVIPRHSRDGLKCKIKNVLKGGKETECGRAELCGELRHALAEQRRVDAHHAEKGGSIPLAQTTGYPIGTVGEGIKVPRAAEGEVRLVLPPELGKAQVKKGEKVKVVRSYLRGSKGLFTEKAAEFASTTGSTLPILACDLSAALLSELSLDTTWLYDDEHWRTVQSRFFGEDRKYLDSVRENAREGIRNRGWNGPVSGGVSTAGAGAGGKGWIWLFSVREARGFLLQPHK